MNPSKKRFKPSGAQFRKRAQKRKIENKKAGNAMNAWLKASCSVEKENIFENNEMGNNNDIEMEQADTENVFYETKNSEIPDSVPTFEISQEKEVDSSVEDISWTAFSAKLLQIIDDCGSFKKFEKSIKNSRAEEISILIEAVFTLKMMKNDFENCISVGESLIKQFESSKKSCESEGSCLVPHDPGLRTESLSESQKKYLITLGPHQPKLKEFPSDGKNRFSSLWYKEYNFLEYSVVKDRAYCFVCCLFPPIKSFKSNDNWYTEGVKAWGKMKSRGKSKLGKLPSHFGSQLHIKAVQNYYNFINSSHLIDVILDKTAELKQIEQKNSTIQ